MYSGDCHSVQNSSPNKDPDEIRFQLSENVDLENNVKKSGPKASAPVYEDPGRRFETTRAQELAQSTVITVTRRDLTNRLLIQQWKLKVLTASTWILLGFYFALIAPPIWLILQMNKMPHTFAWKSLLLPMGCIYDRFTDSASVAIIPLIHTVHSTVVAAILVFHVTAKQKYWHLAAFVIWTQLLAGSLLVIISYALYKSCVNRLRLEMLTSILMFNTFEGIYHQKVWNTTQTLGQCCGINGAQDWFGATQGLGLPKSCFASNQDFLILTMRKVGCYDTEMGIIRKYDLTWTFTTMALLLISLALGQIIIHRNETILRIQNENHPQDDVSSSISFIEMNDLTSIHTSDADDDAESRDASVTGYSSGT